MARARTIGRTNHGRPVLLALLGLWMGCNQIAGIQEGKPYPDACTTLTDCDVGIAGCRQASCEDQRCVYVDSPEGTPLPAAAQQVGDCAEVQCDGLGRTRVVAVELDVVADDNPCTREECVGTELRHVPLSWVTCYTGPSGTELLGDCKTGVQICENGVAVGGCIGERIPRPETCLTIFDDDCDGSINEEGSGCICVPNSIGSCYPGKQESIGYGACAAGMQACNATGTAYETCIGFVTPSAEVCDGSQNDEDCDGQRNEEGAQCTCGDGFLSNGEACDDGNVVDGDGCSSLCRIPGCGNTQTEMGEECDDGNVDDTDACTSQCKMAQCGDGLVHVGVEECDDGNMIDTDACSMTCKSNSIVGEPSFRNCKEILDAQPNAQTGVYLIDPDDNGPVDGFSVLCDMETQGGGWTVVEKSPYPKMNAIAMPLFDDFPVNESMPQENKHRLAKNKMTALKDISTDMRLDCRGMDHLVTAAANLFAGEGGPMSCKGPAKILYSEASLKGYTLTNKEICTWTRAGCAGVWHIDEFAQNGADGCGLPNFFWSGTNMPITSNSADSFATDPIIPDIVGIHDCHQTGAIRYIMLR